MNRRVKYVIVAISSCLAVLLLVGTVLGGSTPPEDAYKHLGVYAEVLSRIKSDYVEEPDLNSVTLGAVNGLLESVDPFASFLNAEQYKNYLKMRDARKGGVGLVLSKRFGYVGVVDAIKGSPADKAGLTTGDMLETIRDVSTRDMPLAYAEMLLHGEPGTSVELTVLRLRRSAEAQKVSLTRVPLAYPRVTARMLPDQTGYIEVPSVEDGKAKEIAAAIAGLQKQGAKKLVLDFRRAADGSPREGLAVADLFLDKGLMSYLQGQKSPRQNFEAQPANTVYRDPLVVITNRGTANGAEIAAAALVENKRAEVVGERTYGDAAARKAITMEDGSAVIISVAKYFSPSGKAIQDTGVTPSVPVAQAEPLPDTVEDSDTAPAPPAEPKDSGDDALLKKALEVLAKGVPAPSAANR